MFPESYGCRRFTIRSVSRKPIPIRFLLVRFSAWQLLRRRFRRGNTGSFLCMCLRRADGIWALRQGSGDILYASQSPVNREVALSPRHIVSVDDAVLYLSEQGLMALQGSDVVLLSRPFDGLPDTLPGDTVSVLDTGLSITSIAVDATPFGNFVKNAVIGYNYIEKELLFLSPGYPYMWVFDLASAQWTRRMTTYKAFHSLYPSLLAIDEDSRVYDLCDEQESGDVEIALVTRAVKLLPDVLKRITCWALRCSDDDAALSLSVWGANRAQEGYGCIYQGRSERSASRTIVAAYICSAV